MTATILDDRTALILVDLQKGIASLPTVHPMATIVGAAARLADAFRSAGRPVVLVNVTGGAPGRTSRQRVAASRPADWAELLPELRRQPGDHLVTKRTWGAFTGTGLADHLHRLGVTQVVVAGVATSMGVESTARHAHELGFNVTIATDAVTDVDPDAHRASLAILEKLGEIGTTDEIIAHLAARPAPAPAVRGGDHDGATAADYKASVRIPLPSADELRAVIGADYDPATTLNVVQMMAGTGDLFGAVTALVKAIFQTEGLDARLRQVIILRAAKMFDVPYEWQANVPMSRNNGLTDAEIAAIAADGAVAGLEDDHVLATRATDELLGTATLTDATLSALLDRHGATMTRKIILVIGWFSMLGLFLNGCRVPLETTDKIGERTSPLGGA